ncbi:MAG: CDP-alcohol phosphatidyltransferase family protein [Kiritimatiellia bacterium]
MPEGHNHNVLPPEIRTWPNRITLARLFLAPLLIVLGLRGYAQPFLALFALLLASDMLDGYLARRLHQQTQLGSQLDTLGDVMMCVTVAIGGWFLCPEQIVNETPFFLATLGLLAISGLTSLIKFHRLPSYHTWTAKTSTALLGIGVWFLFAGITPWIFRIAVGFLAASAIEETAITLSSRQWHPNIPTIFHARKHRPKTRQSGQQGQ